MLDGAHSSGPSSPAVHWNDNGTCEHPTGICRDESWPSLDASLATRQACLVTPVTLLLGRHAGPDAPMCI